jgi:hypothetical protein
MTITPIEIKAEVVRIDLQRRRIEAKLGAMRKPQSFIVSPTNDDRTVIIQSDKSICRIEFATRKAILNTKGSYFPHLHPSLGAKLVLLPQEFISAVLDLCPAEGSQTSLAGGAVIVENTIRII